MATTPRTCVDCDATVVQRAVAGENRRHWVHKDTGDEQAYAPYAHHAAPAALTYHRRGR